MAVLKSALISALVVLLATSAMGKSIGVGAGMGRLDCAGTSIFAAISRVLQVLP